MRTSQAFQCTVCKSAFPFESVKYSKDGKRLLCKTCHSRVHDEVPLRVEKIGVICMGCRYKFSLRKQQQHQPHCPYCNSTQLMKDQTTADEILKDVDGFD